MGIIQFIVTGEVRSAIEAAARRKRMSMAAFVREAALKADYMDRWIARENREKSRGLRKPRCPAWADGKHCFTPSDPEVDSEGIVRATTKRCHCNAVVRRVL